MMNVSDRIRIRKQFLPLARSVISSHMLLVRANGEGQTIFLYVLAIAWPNRRAVGLLPVRAVDSGIPHIKHTSPLPNSSFVPVRLSPSHPPSSNETHPFYSHPAGSSFMSCLRLVASRSQCCHWHHCFSLLCRRPIINYHFIKPIPPIHHGNLSFSTAIRCRR